MTAREDLAAAMRDGSEAGEAGEPMFGCPHDPHSTDPRERVLATLWLRAHARADEFPVDFTS